MSIEITEVAKDTTKIQLGNAVAMAVKAGLIEKMEEYVRTKHKDGSTITYEELTTRRDGGRQPFIANLTSLALLYMRRQEASKGEATFQLAQRLVLSGAPIEEKDEKGKNMLRRLVELLKDAPDSWVGWALKHGANPYAEESGSATAYDYHKSNLQWRDRMQGLVQQYCTTPRPFEIVSSEAAEMPHYVEVRERTGQKEKQYICRACGCKSLASEQAIFAHLLSASCKEKVEQMEAAETRAARWQKAEGVQKNRLRWYEKETAKKVGHLWRAWCANLEETSKQDERLRGMQSCMMELTVKEGIAWLESVRDQGSAHSQLMGSISEDQAGSEGQPADEAGLTEEKQMGRSYVAMLAQGMHEQINGWMERIARLDEVSSMPTARVALIKELKVKECEEWIKERGSQQEDEAWKQLHERSMQSKNSRHVTRGRGAAKDSDGKLDIVMTPGPACGNMQRGEEEEADAVEASVEEVQEMQQQLDGSMVQGEQTQDQIVLTESTSAAPHDAIGRLGALLRDVRGQLADQREENQERCITIASQELQIERLRAELRRARIEKIDLVEQEEIREEERWRLRDNRQQEIQDLEAELERLKIVLKGSEAARLEACSHRDEQKGAIEQRIKEMQDCQERLEIALKESEAARLEVCSHGDVEAIKQDLKEMEDRRRRWEQQDREAGVAH